MDKNTYYPVCVYTGNEENLKKLKDAFPSATLLNDDDGVPCIYMIHRDHQAVMAAMKAAKKLDELMK